MEPVPSSGSPKGTRFTVEPVKDMSAAETDANSPTKARRSGQASIPFQNVVSRIPMLSAISESNTITSLGPASTPWDNNAQFVFDDTTLNGFLPYDDREDEDEMSYVDETNYNTTSDDAAQRRNNNSSNNNYPASTKSSQLNIPSSAPTTQTEAAPTRSQPQITITKDSKISKLSVLSKLPQRSSTSSDKSVTLKSALKDTTSNSQSKVTPQTNTSTSPLKVTMQTTTSSSPSKLTNPTTTLNGPLLSASKKRTDGKDSQQSKQNSTKTQSRDKTTLAPLIAFEDC